MNKDIEEKLSALLVNEEAKEELRRIDKLLNSKSEKIRESASAILVTAGEGCGFSSYGKAFSVIVDSSIALKIKGTSTLLEMVFPKDNEKDEKLFFASPRRMASIRNRYYGTMLISFKEYAGQDLIKSESFSRLLEFISFNKGNIHFMFHILPQFTAKKQLITRLQEILNISEVTLNNPDLDNGFTYVITELKDNGYVVEDNALNALKEDIIPTIIGSKKYSGYRSLDILLDRLYLETALSDDELMVLSETAVQNLMDKYKKEESLNQEDVPRIGFRM